MKKNNNETVTIRKSTLETIYRLLTLSAFAVDSEMGSIGRDIDLGKHDEFHGPKFTHKWNYEEMEKNMNRIFKMNKLVFGTISGDDISLKTFEDDIDYVGRSPEFKDMLKYYGADLLDGTRGSL